MYRERKMKNLLIDGTKYTPEINFDTNTNILNVSGKSYPENTFEYYKPIINWIEEYLQVVEDSLVLFNLDLEYLNSSSLKAYFDIFDILEAAHDKGTKIEINWIFDEDNDIAEETGEDFIADFDTLAIKLVIKN